jgi:hypothetical protein
MKYTKYIYTESIRKHTAEQAAHSLEFPMSSKDLQSLSDVQYLIINEPICFTIEEQTFGTKNRRGRIFIT